MAPPHVLVAEDSALVSQAMRVLFEETGHRVTTAASVAETVAACRAGAVDLLLLDLRLGDEDGLDALRQLNGPATPRLTVALTGREAQDVREQCMAAGCRDVLTKPVPARELLRRVREWLAPLLPVD